MQLVANPGIPDPFQPVVGFTLNPRRFGDLSEHGAQHRRRAAILAATRRMLATEGHEKFTIRSVAEACQLTSQTIHNSFGCKTELLRAAMNQHTVMIDSYAMAQTQDPGLFLLLAIAYCQSAIEQPEFMREYMRAVLSPKWPVRDSLLKFGTDLKAQNLRSMARRGLLKPCIDPAIAAEQIASSITFAMLDWAVSDDIGKLYERLVQANGAILMGILVPQAAREIEDWLTIPANRRWQSLS
jgi:AcrR family transcriptional regulator